MLLGRYILWNGMKLDQLLKLGLDMLNYLQIYEFPQQSVNIIHLLQSAGEA